MSKPAGKRYLLQLRELPSDAPVEVRLRRILKSLLRAYSMRCESIVEMKEPPTPAQPPEDATP